MKITSLKKRKNFLLVAQKGGKVATAGVVLQALPSGGTATRVGFTTTKKLGNAVVRNRIKRRLRAAVSQLLPKHGKNGFDYVVIGRKSALDRDFVKLSKDLTYALHNVTDTQCEASV